MNRRHFLGTTITAAVAAALPPGFASAATPVRDDIAAVTGAGRPTTLARSAVEDLRRRLRGALLLPGNPGYDEARLVLNASVDRRPALVVQPTGTADVRAAVDFARDHELLLAVKCGGHSFSGKSTCDGGLQIDLSRFRAVRVDPAARRAWVAGGSLLGELDHEAMALGLVTTAGTVSHTGVGGLTLGGGFGRLARRFGLALDNVESVDIVTADGRLRHASAEQHPDLYWGVRGGGGNFGVVTSFEFRLHPMQRSVVGGNLVFPISRGRELLQFYADYSLGAPDELYVDAIMHAPAAGKAGVFLLHVCHSGSAADADRALAPLAKLGTPLSGRIAAVDYVAIQRSSDRTDPRNEGSYLKSGFVNGIGADVIDAILQGFEPHAERSTAVFFQHSGGAIGRIAADATAFPHRGPTHNMFTNVSWSLEHDAAPHLRYVKDYWRRLEPFTAGYYTNEVADEAQRVVDENYGVNLRRLQAVKNRYDARNLFRLNANVRPSASS